MPQHRSHEVEAEARTEMVLLAVPRMRLGVGLLERIVDNDTIRRYYDSQERVQIFLEHGEVVRCYIGRSMGPSKVWLMLKRRDSIGGHMVSPRDIRSMRGLGIYR